MILATVHALLWQLTTQTATRSSYRRISNHSSFIPMQSQRGSQKKGTRWLDMYHFIEALCLRR